MAAATGIPLEPTTKIQELDGSSTVLVVAADPAYDSPGGVKGNEEAMLAAAE